MRMSGDLSRQLRRPARDGGEAWDALAGERGERFAWQDASTYMRRPPYLQNLARSHARADIGACARWSSWATR
ncbi:hypothetical protein ACU4GD_22290 [Cupriavidus basilensis]